MESMATTMVSRLAPDVIEEGLEMLAAQGHVDEATAAKLLAALAMRTGRSVVELCRLVVAQEIGYEHLALTV